MTKSVVDNFTLSVPYRPPSTCRGWLDFFLTRLPIIGWVLGYQPSYFIGDIISGITVAIMHIPQGIARSYMHAIQSQSFPDSP